MECSLAALIACFSWSNFYVDTGLAVWDAEIGFPGTRTTVNIHEWGTETVTQNITVSDDYNPQGIFSLGLIIPFDHGQIAIEASHMSSLATTRDRGINWIGVHGRWFPFKR